MANEADLEIKWVKVGIVTGLLVSVTYPLLIFVEMPTLLTITLAGAWGPLLSIASIGLYHVLKINKTTVGAQIAAVANIVAGSIVCMMLIVQLARRMAMQSYLNDTSDEMLHWISRGVHSVQSGLDVSWDIYISIGTFLFALNMLAHPRFGRIFGWTGMTIAFLLLGLNIYTFPTAPAEAGLIDLGPFVGLWYLVVTVQIFRSLRWVEESLA